MRAVIVRVFLAAVLTPAVLLVTSGCRPHRTTEGAAGLVTGLPSSSAYVQPTSPAPSTAGDLSAASLPASYLGFSAKERPPAENEYVPNDTWVHGLDAQQAATEAYPMCEGAGAIPSTAPSAALMGSYLDSRGRLGNGLVLSFDTAAQATGYADAYRQALTSCTSGQTVTAALASGDGWYAGRRTTQGTTWTEGIGVAGKHVILMLVADDAASSSGEAQAAAEGLTH